MEKIIAKKMKMAQIWKDGNVVPVTPLLCQTGDIDAFLSSLKEGEMVAVSGTSRGKGFQGVVKRHGFHGGPKTHGQKDRLRAPGSLGPTAPQRVVKGRKMAGHTGNKRVTVKNLVVAKIQPEEKIVMVRGAVPGNKGGKIEIRNK
ncbi:MAG: 50S ribosomal protein L3 [Candidatus Paceibacterota bacterium]|jgi:large subunit ribosomal protein L3